MANRIICKKLDTPSAWLDRNRGRTGLWPNWHSRLLALPSRLKNTVLSLILLLSLGFFMSGASVYIKAQLAQWLIADAWQHTIKTQHIRKPWSWADTWPVARLRSKHLTRDLYILAGAHGSSLAFGPGHLGATALPGEGASVVGGHRDTHFGFLKNIDVGDTFELQNKRGQWLKFIVRHTRIDDVREGYLG
nr:sortase [Cellvibrionaceae bacterium]